MSFTTLDCDRLSIALSLTAAHERGGGLGRELRDALESGLAPALQPFANGRDDGAQVFIERLVIDGAVGGSWDLDAIVRSVARRIAAAVSAQIEVGGGLRFRDRIEFVAAFLVALADGSAWSRWWFAEFDGYKAMSASNALRSVLLSDLPQGLRCLARLTPSSAAHVLHALSSPDAARVFAAWCTLVPAIAADPRRLFAMSATLESGGPEKARLWLTELVRCERETPGCVGAELVRIVQSMHEFRLAVAGDGIAASMLDIERPLETLLRLRHHLGIACDWIEAAEESALCAIVGDLALRAVRDAGGEAAADGIRPGKVPARCWTRFGGVFLLLPIAASLRWPETWRDLCGAEDADRLLLAVASVASGGAEAPQLVSDAALQLSFGVDSVMPALSQRRRRLVRTLRATVPRPTGDSIVLVGGRLDAHLSSAATALLREFARGLPGMADCTPDYLRRNLLTASAHVAIDEDRRVRAAIGSVPLDAILTLAGRKRGRMTLASGRDIQFFADLDP